MQGHPFCVLMDIAKDETIHPRFFKSRNYTKLIIKTSTHYSWQMYLASQPLLRSKMWIIILAKDWHYAWWVHHGCIRPSALQVWFVGSLLHAGYTWLYHMYHVSTWPPILCLAHSNSVNSMFSFRKLQERCM